MTGPADPSETARQLRAVVAAIDAGEIDADEAQRAYIAGSVDALERLVSDDPM